MKTTPLIQVTVIYGYKTWPYPSIMNMCPFLSLSIHKSVHVLILFIPWCWVIISATMIHSKGATQTSCQCILSWFYLGSIAIC